MAWEILYSEQYMEWWDGLSDGQQEALIARILLLQEHGPDLGRPVVERIQGSTFQNMKELRVSKDGALRVLFIFDPLRRAVFLVGGDKTGEWKRWYREAIPAAEAIYGEFLRSEGLI